MIQQWLIDSDVAINCYVYDRVKSKKTRLISYEKSSAIYVTLRSATAKAVAFFDDDRRIADSIYDRFYDRFYNSL